MLNTFVMDGVSYDFAFDVKRRSVIVSGGNSGMLLNGTYYNDVIGTYLEYDISIAIPIDKINDYVDFYEAITAPVEYHDFLFPYANVETIVRGRIDKIPDSYLQKSSTNLVTWYNISFTIQESISRKKSSGTYTPVVEPGSYVTSKYSNNEHLIMTTVTFDDPSVNQAIGVKVNIEAAEDSNGHLIIYVDEDYADYNTGGNYVTFSKSNEHLIVAFDSPPA